MTTITTDGIQHTTWARPREIGDVFLEGSPRTASWTASGFDLSWYALDAWTRSRARGIPCEIILDGFSQAPDGRYWYHERTNPAYLQEVLGFSVENGRLVKLCPECERYPRHARGCSLAV